MSVKKKQFFRNFSSITLFGVLGTYISSAVIAGALFVVSRLPGNSLVTLVRLPSSFTPLSPALKSDSQPESTPRRACTVTGGAASRQWVRDACAGLLGVGGDIRCHRQCRGDPSAAAGPHAAPVLSGVWRRSAERCCVSRPSPSSAGEEPAASSSPSSFVKSSFRSPGCWGAAVLPPQANERPEP